MCRSHHGQRGSNLQADTTIACTTHVRAVLNGPLDLCGVTNTLLSSSLTKVPRSIFEPLITIFEVRYDAVQDSLDRLYTVLGNCCRIGEIKDAETLALLEKAILVPMSKDSGTRAARSFALCFLPQPDLELFERNVSAIANYVDMEKVAAAILDAYSTGWASSQTADARLWLLAHFIAMGNGKQDVSLGSLYLNALYIQLSSLQPELKTLRIGQPSSIDPSAEDQKTLPRFIEKAVESLVARDAMSLVFDKFTACVTPNLRRLYVSMLILVQQLFRLISPGTHRGQSLGRLHSHLCPLLSRP